MATRPIFIPAPSEFPYVKGVGIEFQWYPGFAKSQVQKTVAALHEAAAAHGISPILEISGKSTSQLGVSLSAFNLPLETASGRKMSVECAYQGSKVFVDGGPYHELYHKSSREAKRDARLQHSGAIVSFNFCGEDFPTEPKTAFYDWLYLTALWQKDPGLIAELETFGGFSDIVFNPKRSVNSQARAAALFVALSQNGVLNAETLKDKSAYLSLITDSEEVGQLRLPFRC